MLYILILSLFSSVIIFCLAVLYKAYRDARDIWLANPIEVCLSGRRLNPDYTAIDQISASLKMIIIGTEDNRFFTHNGIDYKQILYAFFINLRSRRFAMGGSTITQQLAKNIWLSREKTVSRKLREMFLAYYIESRLSKEQILELYLNIIHFGKSKYGVKTASAYWFNKEPDEIGINEAITLAAVLPAPSRYNPTSPYHLFEKAKRLALIKLQKHRLTDREETELLKGMAYNEAAQNEKLRKRELYYAEEYKRRRDHLEASSPSLFS